MKAWDNIESWLEENDSNSVLQLNAPANSRDIRSLVNLTEHKMPRDFLGIYERHDGSLDNNYLFNNCPFFCIEEVISFYAGVKECLNSELDTNNTFGGSGFTDINGNATSFNYSDDYFPISSIDGLAALCVVLSNNSKTHGSVVYFDIETSIYVRIAPNVNSFLEDFANDLTNKKYSFSGTNLKTNDVTLDLFNLGREP